MSREIKYRVWDTKDGKFVEPTYRMYAGELEDFLLRPNGDLFRRTASALEHCDSIHPGRYVVSWYTGLKDREGREIYDGDIVLFDVVPGDRPLEKHAPKCVKGEVKLEPYGPAYGVWSERYCTNVKSIGNRFENPELLSPTN